MNDEDGLAIIWPLKFFPILIDQVHNLLSVGKFLKTLYDNCLDITFANPITKASTFQLNRTRLSRHKENHTKFLQGR